MAAQEVTLRQDEREVNGAQERTEIRNVYRPYTDIYESPTEVVVALEMPGVARDAIDIRLEKGVLTVTGRVDAKKYESVEPIYTECEVGNFSFARTFTLSTKIDSDKIAASVADGVLTIRLPKVAEAQPKRITVH